MKVYAIDDYGNMARDFVTAPAFLVLDDRREPKVWVHRNPFQTWEVERRRETYHAETLTKIINMLRKYGPLTYITTDPRVVFNSRVNNVRRVTNLKIIKETNHRLKELYGGRK